MSREEREDRHLATEVALHAAEKGSPLHAAQKAADERMRAEVEEPAGEWEYRNVGKHDFGPGGRNRRCAYCGFVSAYKPCPSKRQRRWVTPWEPVPEDET